jgi:hypothetical protein
MKTLKNLTGDFIYKSGYLGDLKMVEEHDKTLAVIVGMIDGMVKDESGKWVENVEDTKHESYVDSWSILGGHDQQGYAVPGIITNIYHLKMYA